MSPQTYRRRLTQLYADMEELYKAGRNNPVLQVSLFHLCRARSVVQGKAIDRGLDHTFVWGSRQYIDRTVNLLKKLKRPATLQELLALLKITYPELCDVEYRRFHPAIRTELRKTDRRLAECGEVEGKKLYGRPHWQTAIPYVPGVKHGISL